MNLDSMLEKENKLTVGQFKEILKDVDDSMEVIIINRQYTIADDEDAFNVALCASSIKQINLINYKESPTAISISCLPEPLDKFIVGSEVLYKNSEVKEE